MSRINERNTEATTPPSGAVIPIPTDTPRPTSRTHDHGLGLVINNPLAVEDVEPLQASHLPPKQDPALSPSRTDVSKLQQVSSSSNTYPDRYNKPAMLLTIVNELALVKQLKIDTGTALRRASKVLASMSSDLEASNKFRDFRENKRAPFISYEAAMWIFHSLVVILAIADRFIWNVWPRQTYQIGDGNAGSDKMDGLKEGPWSVKFYDICARVSGRFSIFALNMLLFTRIRCIEYWFSESTWINKYVLDCSNIVNANLRLHIWNGFAMAVFILVHVWSILLPCIVHQFEAQIVPGSFEWPLSERTPPGFKDVDAINKVMSLQVDDVYRQVEMTIIFLCLAPLSYYWFWRRWHVAIHMHRFMAVAFCIDIVRRHSHPHSMMLNTPFFLMWIADKVVIAIWKHNTLRTFHRIKLGDDYMVLLWKSDSKVSKAIGPNFYLKLKDSSVFENPHAFTAFQNRKNVQLSFVSGDWTTAIFIRIFRNLRKFPMSKKESVSHTGRMADTDIEKTTIEAHGPYQGEMSRLIIHAQNQTREAGSCKCKAFTLGSRFCQRCLGKTFQLGDGSDGPVVLIGTGSGINYLLDAMQYRFRGTRKLTILWSTQDNALFDCVRKLVNELVNPNDTHLRIILANTNKINLMKANWQEALGSVFKRMFVSSAKQQVFSKNWHPGIVAFTVGRINFEKEIPQGAQVFFQGSKAVRQAVESACQKNSCTAYFGRGSHYSRIVQLRDFAEKSFVYVNQQLVELRTTVRNLPMALPHKVRRKRRVSVRPVTKRLNYTGRNARQPIRLADNLSKKRVHGVKLTLSRTYRTKTLRSDSVSSLEQRHGYLERRHSYQHIHHKRGQLRRDLSWQG